MSIQPKRIQPPPLASEILSRLIRPPANQKLGTTAQSPRNVVAYPQSRMAVQRATAVSGGGGAPGSGAPGGGGGKRPPLPSQEAEFAAKFKVGGIIVTHDQLRANGFVRMGGGAGWLFEALEGMLRIHAYGDELEGDRFRIRGFAFGQHGAPNRVNLPSESKDFKDWNSGGGPFSFK
ncbi:MAG TPA: hypothetical protein VH640_18505 [Bryobacteraceae bacterium]